MKKIFLRIIVGATLLLPTVALASLGPVVTPDGTSKGDLPSIIMNIINYVLGIVGVVALAYLIYGGFRYITSGGNETVVEEAKSIIINAIIGIVVIGVAAALVNFVIGAVGGGTPAGAI
ncbi:MAG: hypothetical protein Q7S57_00180 [bacterium]|nr:hypothetical protein [bacterium]